MALRQLSDHPVPSTRLLRWWYPPTAAEKTAPLGALNRAEETGCSLAKGSSGQGLRVVELRTRGYASKSEHLFDVVGQFLLTFVL